MPNRDDRGRFGRYLQTLQGLQGSAQQAGPAAAAAYSLVGGIIVCGGIGYAIDAWRGSSHWGLIIGLALGVVVGFYQLIKATWRRP
jgi:F0F1-type ATP synthase assembly protein I